MAIQIQTPQSGYVDRTKTITVTWTNTDSIYNGHQSSYEIQYRLPSSTSWSTLGVVTSSKQEATLNGIFDTIETDAEEYYYRIVVQYNNFDAKATTLGGMASGTDYSDVYSIAFHGSTIGTIQIIGKNSVVYSYPVYDSVKNKPALNVKISDKQNGALPLVSSTSPFSGESNVNISTGDKRSLATTNPKSQFNYRRGYASGYFTVYKYSYTPNYNYAYYSNYSYDRHYSYISSYTNYSYLHSYGSYAYVNGSYNYSYLSGSTRVDYTYTSSYWRDSSGGTAYYQYGYCAYGSATSHGCSWWAIFADGTYATSYNYRSSYTTYYRGTYNKLERTAPYPYYRIAQYRYTGILGRERYDRYYSYVDGYGFAYYYVPNQTYYTSRTTYYTATGSYNTRYYYRTSSSRTYVGYGTISTGYYYTNAYASGTKDTYTYKYTTYYKYHYSENYSYKYYAYVSSYTSYSYIGSYTDRSYRYTYSRYN